MWKLTVFAGLDPGRYRTSVAGEAGERYFGTLDSQMPDSERFKDVDLFVVKCRHCNENMPFAPIGDREVISNSGFSFCWEQVLTSCCRHRCCFLRARPASRAGNPSTPPVWKYSLTARSGTTSVAITRAGQCAMIRRAAIVRG